MKDIETIVLETLSFFEPMSLEKIIIDTNSEDAKSNKDFTHEALLNVLNELVKNKKVKTYKINGDLHWQRIFPQKNIFKRILSRFF